MQKGLFFAITGLQAPFRKELLRAIEGKSGEEFPDTKFVFLDCMFRESADSAALSMFEELFGHAEHPSTKLLDYWSFLSEAVNAVIVPALAEGKVVITDGFDLDALLASSDAAFGKSLTDLIGLHHRLTELLVDGAGAPRPRYLRVDSKDDEQTARWLQHMPGHTHAFNMRMLVDDVRHQRSVMAEYFNETKGIRSTTLLETDGESVDAMLRQTICTIRLALANPGEADLKAA